VTDPDRTVELRLRAAVESSPSGLLMIDAAGTIVLVNREVERLFGYSREELLGQPVELLVPSRLREGHPTFRASFQHSPSIRAMGAGRDLYGRRKDGTDVPVEIGLTPVATTEGLFVISAIVDISARKQAEHQHNQLEEQLRQSQKLEALGRLAGGVAHDFNNILGAIVGYAEMVKDTALSPEVAADVDEVLKAAERGRELVERILRFSRRQELAPRALDLAQVVRDASRLLRATLPAAVEIRLHVDGGTPRVMADATSLHQVVMNLANNAAHAMMPTGGLLEIALDPFYVRDSFVRANPGMHEGLHAMLSVRDTGRGMDETTRGRAFEPFFTTKPPGQGSGLGLSMVHGIVCDHGGAIWIDSREGEGTVVNCILPGVETELADGDPAQAAMPRGEGQRILLVDDEPTLVAVGRRRLVGLGYQVSGAVRPQEALDLFQRDPSAFDLVITDFSMPHVNGLELAREVNRMRRDLPIVLMSGFMESFPPDELRAAGIRRVLAKPVAGRLLAEIIHEVLTGSGH